MAVNKGTDQNYLLNEQYKDSSNLRTRIQLHQQYSTNTYGWLRWVFDFVLLIPQDAHVLELGCGPCDLWLQNLHRIPTGWKIVLSDLSPGMLQKAQNLLVDRADRFAFREFDAQSIPFGDDTFDAVVANHMLYHVPFLDQALSEIQRVLKPTGRLFAATNGENHMRQMQTLRTKFIQEQDVEYEDGGSWRLAFNLENGEDVLRAHFPQVDLRLYVDALRVTTVRPLYDYMLSSRVYGLDPRYHNAFYTFLESEMSAQNGLIQIDKATGMFQAWAENSATPPPQKKFSFMNESSGPQSPPDDPNIEIIESPLDLNSLDTSGGADDNDDDEETKYTKLN